MAAEGIAEIFDRPLRSLQNYFVVVFLQDVPGRRFISDVERGHGQGAVHIHHTIVAHIKAKVGATDDVLRPYTEGKAVASVGLIGNPP